MRSTEPVKVKVQLQLQLETLFCAVSEARMDGFVGKFKNFMNRNDSNLKIPSMGFSSDIYDHFQVKQQQKCDQSTSVNSIRLDFDEDDEFFDNVLIEMNTLYLDQSENELDFIELKKVCKNLSNICIESESITLKNSQRVICKKLRNLIVQKQEVFDKEFHEILQITNDIKCALKKVRYLRSLSKQVQAELSDHLNVLSNFRKRINLQNLLKCLKLLKSLHNCYSSDRIQRMIADKEFSAAIMLLQNSLSLLKNCPKFSCIDSIESKLQDSKLYMEEHLDKCLESLCNEFCAKSFKLLQEAYKLLNNELIIIDQLYMHYMSTIYSKSYEIVQECLLKSFSYKQVFGKQFNQLAAIIPSIHFLSCLIKMCNEMFLILKSYYQLVHYYKHLHINIDYNRYINQKLHNGIMKIWNDVQNKIKILLENCQSEYFKSYEDFIQLLRLIKRMNKVGEDFLNCANTNSVSISVSNSSLNSKSTIIESFITLDESINKNVCVFFQQFHQTKLAELLIFFENENWLKCPFRSGFSVKEIREFWSLRIIQDEFSDVISLSNQSSGNSDNCHWTIFNQNYIFSENLSDNCNFEVEDFFHSNNKLSSSTSLSLSSFSSSSSLSSLSSVSLTVDEVNDSQKNNHYSKELKVRIKNCKPILTNSTINILRTFGRYLHISQLFCSFQNNVILAVAQIFYLYVWIIHKIFSSNSVKFTDQVCSSEFQSMLKNVESDEHCRTFVSKMCTKTLDGHDQNVPSLLKAVTATKSAIFLAVQFSKLHCYVDMDVNSVKNDFHQTINNMIKMSIDLKKTVYLSIIASIFDANDIISSIKSIDWNFKEISFQQNKYVDLIVKQLQNVLARLEEYSKDDMIDLEEIKHDLLDMFAFFITRVLVEGYSSIKKCSTAGRALMQLDFTQLEVIYASIVDNYNRSKIMPYRQFIDHFIKAFYLPDAEFENWLLNHREYAIGHLRHLIECRHMTKKKVKQHLINLISDEHFFS